VRPWRVDGSSKTGGVQQEMLEQWRRGVAGWSRRERERETDREAEQEGRKSGRKRSVLPIYCKPQRASSPSWLRAFLRYASCCKGLACAWTRAGRFCPLLGGGGGVWPMAAAAENAGSLEGRQARADGAGTMSRLLPDPVGEGTALEVVYCKNC
jgi:hypothetical protein